MIEQLAPWTADDWERLGKLDHWRRLTRRHEPEAIRAALEETLAR